MLQTGMFSYTGLDAAKVVSLRKKHHVYILGSGRISISGRKYTLFLFRDLMHDAERSSNLVNPTNVALIARAINDVVCSG